MCPARTQVLSDRNMLLTHIGKLGITVNDKKIRLMPTQRVAFIGMELDLVLMRACQPTRMVQVILSCLVHFRQRRVVFVLTCQHLFGLLTVASLLIPLGLLHLRPLQLWFNSPRLHPKRHCHRQLRMTTQCLMVLLRWRCDPFLSGGVEMLRMCCRELVSTDVTQIG